MSLTLDTVGTGGVIGPQYASSKSALHGLVHWLSLRYCKEGIVSEPSGVNAHELSDPAAAHQCYRSCPDRRYNISAAASAPNYSSCESADTAMMANPTEAIKVSGLSHSVL